MVCRRDKLDLAVDVVASSITDTSVSVRRGPSKFRLRMHMLSSRLTLLKVKPFLRFIFAKQNSRSRYLPYQNIASDGFCDSLSAGKNNSFMGTSEYM